MGQIIIVSGVKPLYRLNEPQSINISSASFVRNHIKLLLSNIKNAWDATNSCGSVNLLDQIIARRAV